MHNFMGAFFSGALAVVFFAAALTANATESISVIPQPQSIKVLTGEFELNKKTIIEYDGDLAEAKLLAATIRRSTGFNLPKPAHIRMHYNNEIVLVLETNRINELGNEGYRLFVMKGNVSIVAATPAGLFYGSQTFLQLLPPEIFSAKKQKGISWKAPAVEISDSPRFQWRGFMLDVSRHFFTVDEVKRVLDLMALHKLNTFHWHLVDDQGWRIEIKKYPKLTEVGAWRAGIGFGLDPARTTRFDKNGRYGGFFTQKQIREVVAYAAARHITVVPEIEMPGHSSAALMAYPQFGCANAKISMPDKGGVFTGVYCAGKDETFEFVSNVLAEVAPLFPGKYIHIGGDEVVKSNWMACAECQARIKGEGLKNEHELQSFFIRRVEKIVNAQGKSLIGWSEIREGGLASSAALMDWIGGGAESASSGHDVVMSPNALAYFDHYQSTNRAAEPKAIGGFLPLEKIYTKFEPIPAKLAPEFHAHVLGGQGNLWTEYVPNVQQVEYMMFPRLGALAEVNWSPKDSRDWENFKARTAVNEKRLDVMKVNYRPLDKPDQNIIP
jgi:hexosaminidase